MRVAVAETDDGRYIAVHRLLPIILTSLINTPFLILQIAHMKRIEATRTLPALGRTW
jgi:hypothetical protein